ncbi:MAG: aminotransferase class V-fold PLP-dependent enzyme [Anaerolineaceae bacterium]|nr:aminotransferase class V-fold PLP-dependent enzyme [Anaerolineaceae bacterium]
MIYLDNAATTFPKPEYVYTAMDAFARTSAVNAGRGAYRAAREAGSMIRETRERLISLIDAREQACVVLTPSVTVAINQIIHGLKWSKDSVAYVSPYEHNAVLRPLELLRKKIGFRVLELPLAEDLSIDLAETEKLFSSCPPSFVAVTAVSNVTGYILPAEKIFRSAKKYGAFTLLDGAQAVGLLKLHFAQLRADAVTFAGHKTLYGSFGAAGFYLKNGVDLEVMLAGGTGSQSVSLEMPRNMPDKMECASKDTVAICALHAALEWLPQAQPLKTEHTLTAYLLKKLEQIENLRLYRAPDISCQAGIVSLNIEGFTCGEASAILDTKHDIAVRAGHHCAALIHAHLKDDRFRGTIRVSLGYFNTLEEIDTLANALASLRREDLKNVDLEALRGLC